MSRARNKIAKWNRRGDRARRKRQADQLHDAPVVQYQAPAGFKLVRATMNEAELKEIREGLKHKCKCFDYDACTYGCDTARGLLAHIDALNDYRDD